MNARRHSGEGRNLANNIMLAALTLFAGITTLTNANAAELGRLFYTPQQRAQLEAHQATGQSVDGIQRNFIIVNGMIQKQGGKRTVWINGKQQPADNGNESTPASVPVTVPGKARPVQLKVGQRLLLDTPVESTTNENKSEKSAPAKPAADEED